MDYARPNRVEDALALLSQSPRTVLAGGTDFYPGLQNQVPRTSILDITAIEEFRHIDRADGFWSIGATVTWSDLIAADLPSAFDGLKLAAREVGSVQIQNRATIAGNLCNASPAADGVPPLLTLDARVEVVSATDTRQVPLAAFITGNRETDLATDEMVSRILVPERSARGVSSFVKLGARKYLVISISMVAARLACEADGRIADAAVSVGACSLVAKRLNSLETDLIGTESTSSLADRVTAAHLELLQPIDDVRATADYRRAASLELIRRALTDAAEKVRP